MMSSVHGLPTQLDIDRANYNPFHVESSLLAAALDLRAQAEASIYLDEGDESRVLYASTQLAQAYDEWRSSLNDETVNVEKREELRLEVPVALVNLRDVTHQELRRLTGHQEQR